MVVLASPTRTVQFVILFLAQASRACWAGERRAFVSCILGWGRGEYRIPERIRGLSLGQ